MKLKRSTIILLIIMLISVLVPFSSVSAVAYGTDFVTSIAYMNIGTSPANITLRVFESNGTYQDFTIASNFPVNAASTIYIGDLGGVGSDFRGSAIMSSSQPLATTLIQIPQAPSTVKNRPLSTGFSAGDDVVLIPTVLKNFYETNSIFTVQNVDSVAAAITVEFVPLSGSVVTDNFTLQPGAAKYYDMGGTTPITATSFNGSVVVSSVQSGTSTPGAVVATSLELHLTRDDTYAFEGINQGGTTIYMPSSFCDWGAGNAINAAFAIQNISETQEAQVTVTYSGGAVDGPHAISPGAKRSFLGCTVNPYNWIGAATVTSTGGQVVAIGKIGGNDLSTAYVGFTQGYEKVACPYVRWTGQYELGEKQQVNIAIQNVGTSTIAAGAVSAKFYNGSGTLLGTTTNPSDIPVGGKWSTNASSVETEFGYTNGGGAIITGPSGSKLAVIARAATRTTGDNAAGEDYNAIPIQ
jgi:hypothetical protein